MLRDLGVKPSKQLPTSLVDKALSTAQYGVLTATEDLEASTEAASQLSDEGTANQVFFALCIEVCWKDHPCHRGGSNKRNICLEPTSNTASD
jgi:hypothetical protein